jgi:hypothetical protein
MRYVYSLHLLCLSACLLLLVCCHRRSLTSHRQQREIYARYASPHPIASADDSAGLTTFLHNLFDAVGVTSGAQDDAITAVQDMMNGASEAQAVDDSVGGDVVEVVGQDGEGLVRRGESAESVEVRAVNEAVERGQEAAKKEMRVWLERRGAEPLEKTRVEGNMEKREELGGVMDEVVEKREEENGVEKRDSEGEIMGDVMQTREEGPSVRDTDNGRRGIEGEVTDMMMERAANADVSGTIHEEHEARDILEERAGGMQTVNADQETDNAEQPESVECEEEQEEEKEEIAEEAKETAELATEAEAALEYGEEKRWTERAIFGRHRLYVRDQIGKLSGKL